MTTPAAQIFKTRSGPMLALTTDFFVGKAIELYGEYCPEEGRILSQGIRPGMNVIEVGANMGAHSVDMARACAPGLFYAFEPQPRLFQVLCANLALNNIANARAYPDACGAEPGEALVPLIDYDRVGNFGGVELARESGGEGIKVTVRTIDGLGLDQCGLIKIDVEGFEPDVLRGAEATIRRCRPVLYVENDRTAQQQQVIDLVASMGYRMYWHAPRLFDPGNFRGETRDIYNNVASLNMLCVPAERNSVVQGLTEIDPANWTSPIRLKR